MRYSILFILHLPPPVHGAAMMGKYIHDSKLINETFDCHYINLTTAKSLKDIGRGGVGKLWKFVCLLVRIVREVRRTKPQLVYVTPNACGGAFYKDFIVVQALKAMGCRIVVHYHNKGVATRQDRLPDHLMYKRFFKGIKVILLAEALYADVQKYVERKDVFICPNGIPETLRTEPPAKRSNRTPRLLFLSNLLVSKGVFVLLDACQIIKEKGYSFVCEFVGGETAEIDALRFQKESAKRRLNEVVFYWGKKYGEEKTVFMKKANVFVFPTFYPNECFPLVLLEAMEQGIPCISTGEGGIPAIISHGKTGYIVERNDAQAIAEKAIYLLQYAGQRTAMGQAGREKFLKEFTLGRFENQMKHILERILYT